MISQIIGKEFYPLKNEEKPEEESHHRKPKRWRKRNRQQDRPRTVVPRTTSRGKCFQSELFFCLSNPFFFLIGKSKFNLRILLVRKVKEIKLSTRQ